jgi:hypothetical protein
MDWFLDRILFSPNKVPQFLQIRAFRFWLFTLAWDKAIRQGKKIFALVIQPIAKKFMTFFINWIPFWHYVSLWWLFWPPFSTFLFFLSSRISWEVPLDHLRMLFLTLRCNRWGWSCQWMAVFDLWDWLCIVWVTEGRVARVHAGRSNRTQRLRCVSISWSSRCVRWFVVCRWFFIFSTFVFIFHLFHRLFWGVKDLVLGSRDRYRGTVGLWLRNCKRWGTCACCPCARWVARRCLDSSGLSTWWGRRQICWLRPFR